MSKRLVQFSFFALWGIVLCLIVVSLTLVLSGSPVNAYVAPVTTDLWDISNGAQVTYTTGVYSEGNSGSIANIFGGNLWSGEGPYWDDPNQYTTLFQDGKSSGYVHIVQWQTPTSILLTAFNLIASHDTGGRNINYRGFRDFTLQAWIGGSWVNIYSYHVSGDTYNPNYLVNGRPYHELALYVTGLNVDASQFRAEFVQAGDVDYAEGPRIIELDGFSAPVPIPPSVWLLGGGLVGLLGLRRRFANYLKK